MNNNTIAAVFVLFAMPTILLSQDLAAEESDWRVFSEEPNGDVHFFDASRVESSSNMRTVWTRIRYNTSVMAASSYQSLLEIDCEKRTERTLQRTFFSDKDWERPAMSTDKKKKSKRAIRKGSAFERLFEVVCTP